MGRNPKSDKKKSKSKKAQEGEQLQQERQFRNTANAGYENSQPAKFCRLRKFRNSLAFCFFFSSGF